jgi:hypothetical protein
MITNTRKLGLSILTLALTGCSRAPSFDILGSFFPAWLLCLFLGVALTALTRQLIVRTEVALAVPILTYPSLTAVFASAVWLAFFR